MITEDVARRKASGIAYEIDDSWRRFVLERMRVKGLSQADVRREIGCSKGAISDALSFKTGKRSSRWVPAIHAVLGLPPPAGAMSAASQGSSRAEVANSATHAPSRDASEIENADASAKAERDLTLRRDLTPSDKRSLLHALVDAMTEEQAESWLRDVLSRLQRD